MGIHLILIGTSSIIASMQKSSHSVFLPTLPIFCNLSMLACLALYSGITAMSLMPLLEKAMLESTKENFDH